MWPCTCKRLLMKLDMLNRPDLSSLSKKNFYCKKRDIRIKDVLRKVFLWSNQNK